MKTTDSVFELFLNYACQAKCAFCYNPPITDELLRRELSLSQAAGALLAAARGGATRLNLHGGEVTLREDLPKILRLARKAGFKDVTLVTNGVRLSDARYTKSLVAAGLSQVRFSVHAPRAVDHDAIVEVPGAFAKILRAMGHLRRLEIPIGLNFVMTRGNSGMLPDFVSRFVLEEHVEDVIVYFPHERGMMALNADRIGIRYRQARVPLAQAAAVLARAGKEAALLIANVPPCALPEYTELLLDWERATGAAAEMIGPEGGRSDLQSMKDDQKQKVPACAACALRERCRGVEKEYVLRYGGAEFAALTITPPTLREAVRR